jgi:hypothetical protein
MQTLQSHCRPARSTVVAVVLCLLHHGIRSLRPSRQPRTGANLSQPGESESVLGPEPLPGPAFSGFLPDECDGNGDDHKCAQNFERLLYLCFRSEVADLFPILENRHKSIL